MRTVTGSRWWKAAPAVAVTAPLAGFAFQLDERLIVYQAARLERDLPLNAVTYAYGTVDSYLNRGNFRPLGRVVEGLVAGFAFEVAEATRLPPHVVMGAVRVVALVVLAFVCAAIVGALARSSGSDTPAVVLYPLAFGAVLVVNGRSGPLVHFSFVFITAVALIFLTALAVARDKDMHRRTPTVPELAGMGLLGAAAAAYYDLAYVAPPLAAAYIAARAVAGRIRPKDMLETAAVRRWAALAVGFLAVFVPTRVMIAARCDRLPCYVGSDINLSPTDMIEVLPVRALAATPAAGWQVVSGLVETYDGPPFGLADLMANSFLALLVVGIAALTIVAARNATGTTTTRFAAAVGLFGLATVGLSSLLISLSTWIQTSRINYGWRDTLLTQTGWSLTIIGILALTLSLTRKRGMTVALTVCLGAGLAFTLLANAQLAHVDRHTPLSTATNLVDAATVNIDTTPVGNRTRCALVDAYTRLEPETFWLAGKVPDELDRLMLDRTGRPFCDPG